jgi:uncharacterized protein (TIGR00375 family)
MQLIADLHLHSRYARATSKEMEISKLAEYAKIKGLNLLGTGDFTFSEQLKDIKSKLVPIEGTGLYTYDDIFFMLTTEMATFYFEGNKSRRVHHLVHAPDIDTVEQIIDVLTKRGANTGIDGRLMIKASSPEIVELLKQINKDIHIVPAHIWTPYFGCLGSATGFDSIEDCYKDMAKYIYAVETGLSSDPPMNWRLSSLDKFALMSNSDSHSPWPWRLGREANVFDLEKPSYWELWDAVKKKDKKKFLYTIEVDPNYGKYHYTGHRDCKVVLSPKEALRIKNTCPVCRKKLTVGVLQRVEELADREEGFVPKDAIPYKSLLPLYEIISFALKEKKLNSKKILEEQNKLIKNFGNELNVIINVSFEELTKVTNEIIARAIIDVREGRIKYIPGYDGVYGEPVFGEKQTIKKLPQKNLFDY